MGTDLRRILLYSAAVVLLAVAVGPAGAASFGPGTVHQNEIHSPNDDHQDEDLSGFDLSFTTFASSDLRGVIFTGATLFQTNFTNADLRGVTFSAGMNMNGAILNGADIRGRDLSGVSLLGADLRNITSNGGTKFTGALFDGNTQYDAGFDPLAAGMVSVPEPTPAALALLGMAGLAWLGRPSPAPVRDDQSQQGPSPGSLRALPGLFGRPA